MYPSGVSLPGRASHSPTRLSSFQERSCRTECRPGEEEIMQNPPTRFSENSRGGKLPHRRMRKDGRKQLGEPAGLEFPSRSTLGICYCIEPGKCLLHLAAPDPHPSAPLCKKLNVSQVWLSIPVTLALGRFRQKDHEFKVILSHTKYTLSSRFASTT